HTLWNIAYTILTYHFGNSNKMDDFGVWRFLEALGVSPEKVIQKKDFTKMLQHMEQVHEATLWHCIRTVMETDNDLVEEELKVLPSDEWTWNRRDMLQSLLLSRCTSQGQILPTVKQSLGPIARLLNSY
ncbi:hypothetical protein PGTUg99_000037, partial [Puccinia graminis f. sp. tritici]